MKKKHLYIGLAILAVGGIIWWNKSKSAPTNMTTNIISENVDYSQCEHLGGNQYMYNGSIYTITSAPCANMTHFLLCWDCIDSNGNPCHLYNHPI